jgi:hypothetical protein
MPIAVQCPCGKRFSIPDERAGTTFRCHICRRQLIATPASSTAKMEEGIVSAAPSGGPSLPLPTQSSPPPADATAHEDVDPHGQRAAFVYASDHVEAGVDFEEIQRRMIGDGFDSDLAESIVEKLKEDKLEKQRESANRNMIIGGILCLVGTLVTVFSYLYAEALGAGKYVIAYGAIIVGFFQFMRGLGQRIQKE